MCNHTHLILIDTITTSRKRFFITKIFECSNCKIRISKRYHLKDLTKQTDFHEFEK
jgi:hypothetical protein